MKESRIQAQPIPTLQMSLVGGGLASQCKPTAGVRTIRLKAIPPWRTLGKGRTVEFFSHDDNHGAIMSAADAHALRHKFETPLAGFTDLMMPLAVLMGDSETGRACCLSDEESAGVSG